jgi:hypothetical protein
VDELAHTLGERSAPSAEALRITERFRRPDIGHLELEETFEDSTIYARPWTIKVRVDLVISLSDTRFIIMGERMEFFRNEHNEVTYFLFHAVEEDLKATKRPPANK